MEFMGFKQCMDYLLGCGISITTFTSIASHMKKVLTYIVHYFDIWHLKESKSILFLINMHKLVSDLCSPMVFVCLEPWELGKI